MDSTLIPEYTCPKCVKFTSAHFRIDNADIAEACLVEAHTRGTVRNPSGKFRDEVLFPMMVHTAPDARSGTHWVRRHAQP